MQQEKNWWADILTGTHDRLGIREAIYLVLLRIKRADKTLAAVLDLMLQDIMKADVYPITMMALCRTTSKFQSQLKSYDAFFEVTWDKLQAAGHEPEKLLMGLPGVQRMLTN